MKGDVQEFAALFNGRGDCYGNAGPKPYCVKQVLDAQVWTDHLYGKYPIGVYPRLDDDVVHWGCSDIDTGYDAIDDAQSLRVAIKSLGLRAFVEKTRKKGYHVWVLLPKDVWVPATTMRNALLMAHEVAGLPPTEVNPKQVTGGLGNFVRLPYPERGMHGTQVIVDFHGDPVSLNDFLFAAARLRNDEKALQEAADLYVAIHGVETTVADVEIPPYDGGLDLLVARLSDKGRLRFVEPLPSLDTGRVDRSRNLYGVVDDARQAGLSTGGAYALLADAHSRWGTGKYDDRPDELARIVAKVYGR